VGIARARAEQHAIEARAVEALGAGDQELADAIQRIALAAPVAEGGVLHAPAT
jgi:hypothetical protein